MSEPTPPPEPAASPATAPRGGLVLVAVVVVLAIVGATVWFVATSEDDDEDGSACLEELVGRMPDDVPFVEGADLEAARELGYEDTSLDALVDSTRETGVRPDPVVWRTVAQFMELDEASLPHDPSDVRCWMGSPTEFALRGAFDDERVRGAALGEGLRLSADSEVLVSDRSLLREPTGDAPVGPDGFVDAYDALDREGDVVAFSFVRGQVDAEPERSWVGMGLAPAEEDGAWDLAVVWAYDDEQVAVDAEEGLRSVLAERSILAEQLADAPEDALERDGAALRLRARLDGDPEQWLVAFQRLDAAISFDPYADDET